MKVNFKDIIPTWLVDAPVLVNKSGDVAFCFLYKGPEVLEKSRDGIGELTGAFDSGISLLDEGYVIQKQDVFLETKYKAESPENNSFLSNAFYKNFDSKGYLRWYSYLFIIKVNGLSAERDYSTKRIGGDVKTQKLSIDRFRDTVYSYVEHLKRAGAKIEAIKDDDSLCKLIDGYLTGYEHGVLQDVAFESDGIIVGSSKRLGIISLNSDNTLPEFVNPYAENTDFSRRGNDSNVLHSDFMYSLGYGLKSPHTVNTFIFLDGQRYWREKLEKHQKKLVGSSGFGLSNEEFAKGNKAFLDETMSEDSKKVVRCHVNLMYWSDNGDKFRSIESEVKSRFISLGCVPHLANSYDNKTLFLSSMPGNAATLPAGETFLTHSDVASALILKESLSDLSKGRPSTHGLVHADRFTGIPLYRDAWFKPYKEKSISARNELVIGKTGGGKTFNVIEKLRQYYELGFDINMLDIGRTTEVFAKLYGGNYIIYEEGMSLGINPFEIKKGLLTVSQLEFLTTFVGILWKPGQELSEDQKSALDKVLTTYYQSERVDEGFKVQDSEGHDIKTFYAWVSANQNEVKDIARGNTEFFDIESFLLSMEKYVSGKFDKLFVIDKDKPLVDFTKRLTVWELDNIKDHPTLFPIFAMLITYLCTEVMWTRKGSEKLFWFEEAWKVVEKPGMASYIKYLFKTVRKFDGGVGLSIQQLGDISVPNSNLEETVIANTDIYSIVYHTPALADSLARKLKWIDGERLTDHRLSLLNSISNDVSGRYPYTEYLSIIGNDAKVVRTMVSKEQAAAYMSEMNEKQKLYALANQHNLNLEDAIKMYLKK